MVAADVPYKLFDENQNEPSIAYDGLHILSLVKDKIHILHSNKDLAMIASFFANFGTQALGFSVR